MSNYIGNIEEIQNISNIYTEETGLSNSQEKFLTEFSGSLHKEINFDEKLQKVSSDYVKQMYEFIKSLEKGSAELEGTDKDCRSVCVAVQGAIEEVISQWFQSGEIEKGTAVFLTPLPCTPLRKKGETKGLSNETFEESRQYTLDKREETVRKLMKKGCQVITAYSQKGYDKFVQEGEEESDKKNQSEIYKEALSQFKDHLQDAPLGENPPEDLVGAVYLLTDKKGNQFYIATQGLQALDAKPAVWKKWLGVKGDSKEGEQRVKEVLTFIGKQGGPTIQF